MTQRAALLYAVFLTLLAVAVGCGQELSRTGLGIAVDDGGYAVDSAAIDDIALSVGECLSGNGYAVRGDYENLVVRVRCDRECTNNAIDCDISIGPDTWVHGYQSGNYVLVTPSLAALGHELIHWHGYAEGEGGNSHPATKVRC